MIIKNNIYIVRICGVEVKKFFRFLEEDFSWIKNAPTEVKVAILRGLWDSEGTVGRKMLLFAVTDKRIAELFCMLCSELGIETKSYYYSYICQVHIHKLEDRIKFYNRVGMTSKKKMKRFWKSLNRGKYALEDYLKVLELRKKGFGSRRISKLTRIPRTTVRNWINGKQPPCARLLQIDYER